MDDEMTVNLTAALRSNATDLSGVANQLAGLSTDQEIEHQAKVLDCVAEDASQGAAILRAMIARRNRGTDFSLDGCQAIQPVRAGSPAERVSARRDRGRGSD
jgi:hypothetical protein